MFGGKMKVKELKAILSLLKDRDDDLEVAIPVQKRNALLGVSPHVQVKAVGRGIDWDSGLFMLYSEGKLAKTDDIKKIWYILDEIAVKCSAKHLGKSCLICERAEEAMKLCPDKPNHQECSELYNERKGLTG
jgi:hypothetical protein